MRPLGPDLLITHRPPLVTLLAQRGEIPVLPQPRLVT
ncbi:hypothetical protein E2C01_067248 [Portunus trituberculatus]|uniref:Uncharacterized protein n=1 Tax=Portunus trituberculatus TaxID=210409 RepID=A0A5B7HWY9_PORTR|nr:hypothetical protein [Portunus trituberculatus]